MFMIKKKKAPINNVEYASPAYSWDCPINAVCYTLATIFVRENMSFESTWIFCQFVMRLFSKARKIHKLS